MCSLGAWQRRGKLLTEARTSGESSANADRQSYAVMINRAGSHALPPSVLATDQARKPNAQSVARSSFTCATSFAPGITSGRRSLLPQRTVTHW